MNLVKICSKVVRRFHKITWNGQRSIFLALLEETLSYLLRNHIFRRLARTFVSEKKVEKIIFLCGCFNSGTTILRDVLGSHPEIKVIPREGVVYTRLISDFETEEWARFWCKKVQIQQINKTEFCKLTPQALLSDWRFWLPKRGWFMEKSISNLARMKELQDLFPEARFIIISRDPLPVIEGITRRTRALVENPVGVYTDDMAYDQWKLCNELATEQVRVLKNCLQLTYEQFIEAPDVEINRILNFLNLESSAVYEGSILKIRGIGWEIKNGNSKSVKALCDERYSVIKKRLEQK